MPHARKAHWPNCLKRELQAKEYVTLQKEAKEIIVRKFRSPLFLAIAILMTAIAAISVLTMLLSFTSKSGNMVVDLIASLPMILCSLASAIAFWKMYGRKTEFTENKMNGTNAYMRLMEVVGILSCILAGIVALLLIFIAVTISNAESNASDLLNKIQQTTDRLGLPDIATLIYSGSTAIVIILILAAALLMAFFICYTLAFSKTAKHFKFFRNAFISDNYNTAQPPSFLLFFSEVSPACWGLHPLPSFGRPVSLSFVLAFC